MRLAGIREGDLVRVDFNGTRYYGRVLQEAFMSPVQRCNVLEVASLGGRPIPAHFPRARQVIEHYRRAKG